MRAAMTSLIALALLLPAVDAAAQSGKFCDPSWCMTLDRDQRAQLGGQLARAVAALKLPFRDPLKPIRIEPKGMPWKAARLRKLPRKSRMRAVPVLAAPFDNGAFPFPLRFLGSFKLPKKKGAKKGAALSIMVELSSVAAGVPDPSKDQFCEVREDRVDYFTWEKAWATGKARKRPDLPIEVNLVIGARLQGVNGVPLEGQKATELAPLRSIHIKLSGPRRVVDGIARRIDLRALKELVRAK